MIWSLCTVIDNLLCTKRASCHVPALFFQDECDGCLQGGSFINQVVKFLGIFTPLPSSLSHFLNKAYVIKLSFGKLPASNVHMVNFLGILGLPSPCNHFNKKLCLYDEMLIWLTPSPLPQLSTRFMNVPRPWRS